MSAAVVKIKEEMSKNSNNPYFQIVGGFLLDHIDNNPQDNDKVTPKDKTIAKSLDAMRAAAEKKKVGNCAVLTDQEGFEVVLKYFEIDTKAAKSVTKTAQTVIKTKETGTKSNDFDVKLGDFM
ncbi:hypothetical protein RJD24_18735 [Bacillaceae bacterium IKA-2]|nr:hypothetical protein RJD24_18735 [Bacillaceae bacterium IKA-2]